MNTERLEKMTSSMFTVAEGVWGCKELFVNFYMIKDEGSDDWVLVDAGLKWSAAKIKSMAAELFGENAKPSGIVLTHGHFDHVGALRTLIEDWNVPVYAHEMEFPYLNGKSSYPPPDPTVGGGMMSMMSWTYPSGPINLGDNLKRLPYDGSIPGLSGWRYIQTSGHSPGHISLFRERDRLVIAGDAIVTTQAESAICALTHSRQLSGPPKYFTCNWASSKQSAIKIEALNPEILATGHGKPMQGEELRTELRKLISSFDEVAIPKEGRYVNEPAVTNENGVMYLPPATEKVSAVIKAIGVALTIGSIALIIYQSTRKKQAPVKQKLTELLQHQYN